MTHAGMFLSHPPIATKPSKPSHPTTVSIESAITSLETNEYFIPSVPMDMPSDIVIVLKITDLPPLESIDLAVTSAKSFICILQGVTILQVEATPICGSLKSLSLKPTALNIDLLGDLSFPSTTFEEYFRIAYCTNLPNILNLQPCKNLISFLPLANKSMSRLFAINVEDTLYSSHTTSNV